MSQLKKSLQLTLGIIKPDASLAPYAVEVLKTIIDRECLRIVAHKITHLDIDQAGKFYSEHKNKFFYHRLVSFMSSGPLHVFILAHENAILKWRQLMGPTKVYRAHIQSPKSIRGRIGLTDTRNSTHGSDSVETAMREIQFFFPEFSLKEWEEKGKPVSTFEESLRKLKEDENMAEKRHYSPDDLSSS